MKKLIFAIVMTAISLASQAQTKINVQVNGHTLTATLADNSSAKAFAELLAQGPITINASEYGGFEMVGSLPQSIVQNNQSITTKAGDIILYVGRSICFYYGVNTWNFTRLGAIDNASQYDLKTIYGASSGSATFVVSLVGSGVDDIKANDGNAEVSDIFTLDGKRLTTTDTDTLSAGTYIVKAGNKTKKIIKR